MKPSLSPMKRSLLFAAALSINSIAYAQLRWPAITQTNKPWTRWWWEGSAVNKPDLTTSMQQYQQVGLGGLEITPIYGVRGAEKQFIPYLTPQWVDMLEYTLAEAKKLNLGIDMATGTGWPFGGPWVTPADACKNISLKTYTLKAGEQLAEKITFVQQPLMRTVSGKPVDIKTLSYPVATNKNLQEYAFDQVRYEMPLPLTLLMAYDDKGNSIDLTNKVTADGTLNWTATNTTYTLYALFQGWHGKMVERAAPGGEGDVIDHFNLPALQRYLGHFDSAFADRKIQGLRSFFNDSYEVDDARGQANWTPDILKEFKQRRGYDLAKELPALYGKDTPAKNMAVLSDYRQTISELLLEKFTTPWHAWAKAKGALIRNQSHGSPANILDLYGAIDIPETEGTDLLRFKFATSTAHVMGKPLASAEAATWLNEHFISTLGNVKLALDKYFLGGVNHIFYHGTNFSPANDPWPGWLFYAAVHFHPNNPFWKDFPTLNQYVARCQSFLQAGKPDNDILLYFPIYDRFAEPGKDLLHHFDGMEGFEKSEFKAGAAWMLDNGYAFDLISDKQLKAVTAQSNKLLSGGNTYQTILVPPVEYIPLETVQTLVKLAEKGATIIFHQHLPKQLSGLDITNGQRDKQFHDLLAGREFKTVNGIQTAIIGQGKCLIADDLSLLLPAANIAQEPMYTQGLQCIRRNTAGGKYYFITNTGNTGIDTWVPLQTRAAGVALFDPMQQRSGLAKTKKDAKGNTLVYLQLAPGESCLLETSAKAITGNTFPYIKIAGTATAIKGNWKLTFLSGGPVLPDSTTVNNLGSWTGLPGEDVKHFSGTAQYSIQFAKPAGTAKAFLLDLGNVQESAEVFINGKRIATLIGPSYKLVVNAADLRATSLLQVKVTNSMANRIIDMDKKGQVYRKFYNTNFPARLAENRGADGLFTAAKWEPRASGLTSEVTLTPVEYNTQQPAKPSLSQKVLH